MEEEFNKIISGSSVATKEHKNYWCACNEVEELEPQASLSEDDEPIEEINVVKKSVWQTILEESKRRNASYISWLKKREKVEQKNEDSQASYLDREIFPILLPALEETLRKARQWDALDVQKCRFNGLDYLAEYLWNKNPRWPRRNIEWLEAFDIPQFKLCMRLNPRPIFPKSWLWSPEEAAVYIQRWIRGWLVRKRAEVQELRQFWKVYAADKKTFDEDRPKVSRDSRISNLCERYKIKRIK